MTAESYLDIPYKPWKIPHLHHQGQQGHHIGHMWLAIPYLRRADNDGLNPDRHSFRNCSIRPREFARARVIFWIEPSARFNDKRTSAGNGWLGTHTTALHGTQHARRYVLLVRPIARGDKQDILLYLDDYESMEQHDVIGRISHTLYLLLWEEYDIWYMDHEGLNI